MEHTGTRRYVHLGRCAVRPYLYGRRDSLDLLTRALGAEIVARVEYAHGGSHIEACVDDSIVVLELSEAPPSGATKASIYVYVPDVDAAHREALACGATELDPPGDKPYDERSSGVRDAFGNTWWLSTYRKPDASEPTADGPDPDASKGANVSAFD